MNKRVWWPAIVLCLAVVACAQEPRGPGGGHQPPSTADQECRGSGNCEIDVRITCAASGCTGSVAKRVDVFNDAHQPKVISWKLTGDHQQYGFKDQKIDLDAQVFSCERPSQNRKEIRCTDLFTTTGQFEYQLHVARQSDGSEITVDPWVVSR